MTRWKREIVDRSYYRTPSHPDSALDSVIVTLTCGHRKGYKGSKEPDRYCLCDECEFLHEQEVRRAGQGGTVGQWDSGTVG